MNSQQWVTTAISISAQFQCLFVSMMGATMDQNTAHTFPLISRYTQIWTRREQRFSLFRFITILIAIGLLFPLYQHGKSYLVLGLIFTFFYFTFCVAVHRFIKKNLRKWEALTAYKNDRIARRKRMFDPLREKFGLENDLLKQIRTEHGYATDLDIVDHLFPLMNTCLFPETKKKLLDLLLTGGEQKSDEKLRKARIERAQKIAQNPHFVFRMGLLHEILEKEKEEEHSFVEKNETDEVLLPSQNSIQKSPFFLGVALLTLVFWVFYYLPILWSSVLNFHFENIIMPLVIYGVLIYLFNGAYQKLVAEIKQKNRFLFFHRIIKTQKFAQKSKLAPTTSSLLFYPLLFLISYEKARINPLNWLFIHIFFPLDSMMYLFAHFLQKKAMEFIKMLESEWVTFDLALVFAHFQIENKNAFFPNVKKKSDFKIKGMSHPLIPCSEVVPNDFSLHDNKKLILITGSNMSGKSTFLRTLGLNILLNNIGAPVFAENFDLPFCRILCAIRVQDSIERGQSYFAAEVHRLGQIIEKTKKEEDFLSVIFIDEILKGTNNKERYIGSKGMITYLSKANDITFVTTHDLGLVTLEKEEATIENYHFSDKILNSELSFDYQLKPGPCQTTNALHIMQHAGLPVPTE